MSTSIYPKSLNFGILPVGSRSRSQSIHLVNHGAPVNISEVEIGGHFVTRRPSINLLGASPELIIDDTIEGSYGPELLSDGDAEESGVASWPVGNSATITKQSGSPYGGLQSLRIAYNGVDVPYTVRNILVVGRVYRWQGVAKGDGTNAPRIGNWDVNLWTGEATASWQEFDVTFTALDTRVHLQSMATAAGYSQFDSMSIKESTYTGLSALITYNNGTSDPYVEQAIMTVGQVVRISGKARGDGTFKPIIKDGSTAIWTGTNSTADQPFDFTVTALTTLFRLSSDIDAASGYVEFEDVSVRKAASIDLIKTTTGISGTVQRIAHNGEYVFLRSSTSDIYVYKINAEGSPVLIDTNDAMTPNDMGGIYHSGRFLYACNDDTLCVFKLDTNEKLILIDVIPTDSGIQDVHGFDNFIFIIDSVGVKSYSENHLGVLTPIDSLASVGGSALWSRSGRLFVAASWGLINVTVSESGRLTYKEAYYGGPVVTTHGDEDFIYAVTSAGDLLVMQIGTDGALSTLSTTALPTASVADLYWDGGYLHLCMPNRLLSYGIDRATGATTLESQVYDASAQYYASLFHGGNLIVVKSVGGSYAIDVFSFGDSRVEYPVNFVPNGYGILDGVISVQGSGLAVTGEAPLGFDPQIVERSNSRVLDVDTRWDKICYQWFGSFDRLQELYDANDHIDASIKARLYVPRGTIVYKPVSAETGESSIGAVSWRR